MTDTTTDQLLRAPDVLAATGATYRQLDYWTRQGLITPAVSATGLGPSDPVAIADDPGTPGSGYNRFWAPAEIEAIRRAVLVARALPHLTNDVVFRIARSTTPVDLGDGIVVTTPWSAP